MTDSAKGGTTFQLEEATISEMQAAIQAGLITCVQIVQHYIDRARAFNGVASVLVTKDGQPVAAATGTVRAGAALSFPTDTIHASEIFPDLDLYEGKPLEFGRMEPTMSNPSVQQQFGMITGIQNGSQVNALSVLNIRGERSVVCRGDFDRHPSKGPLPPGAPAVSEFFRHYPDALERAAELDAAYGTNPDLEKMPMYGVVFSFKDPFDCKDMRSVGGGDAAYDIDVPARDHLLVEKLRDKGAIIFAKAVSTEYNGRAGDPGGDHLPDTILPSILGYQRTTWGGNPANPYDTTRSASLGSSSGSALSVSTNLVMASLGEETRASCRGPSNHNAVALILPHKAMLGFNGGAIGADIYTDRTGVICRSVVDCARVVDALVGPGTGYYDPRDAFTTVPRSSILPTPFISHLSTAGVEGALEGVRIGIVRESLIVPDGSRAELPIVAAANAEIKAILRDHLGATLVQSNDPQAENDSELATMIVDFKTAVARLVPIFMPDLLFRLGADGLPVYKDVAAAIVPTPFVAGGMPSLASPTVSAGAEATYQPPKIFGSGTMKPIDYCVGLAEGKIEPPRNLDIHSIQEQELATTFRFHIPQYLMRRADEWAKKGFTETLTDFAALNARSKFWGDDQRAAFLNWDALSDPRNRLDGRQGVNERIMLRELLRRVDMMVLLENQLDAFVRLHSPWVPGKIGHANQPRGGMHNITLESFFGPNAGLTEILIPAGYVDTAYDPVFALSADRKRYVPTASTIATPLPAPGLPYSLVFRSEPGKEDVIVRIASAYEAASRRRVPPPAFGPLPRALCCLTKIRRSDPVGRMTGSTRLDVGACEKQLGRMEPLSQEKLAEPWSMAALDNADTLQERVTSWLRGAVLSGHFAPGDRLLQSDIAQHLKVSITPVREAMRDLAVEGLLTLNPRRGISVRALSLSEVQELRMLSAMLERKCGQLIAARITDAELSQARQLERTMAALADLQTYYPINNQFHLFLYETARSPELTSILRRIHDATLSYLPVVFVRTKERYQSGLDEHRAFIAACGDRDVERAGDVMMRHWDLMFAEIEDIITANPPVRK